MRFYYWSFLNWIPITIFYVIAAAIIWVIWILIRDDRKAKYAIWGLIAVMGVLPWTEEIWIAWNFDRMCKKDAGIFVDKTVEVDGLYDATRSTHDSPPTLQAIDEYERSGYRFYERRFRDMGKVVHIEKKNGVWTATVIDRPTARYLYTSPNFNAQVGHKIWRNSEAVVDAKTGETLAVSVRYGRQAPWFFMGLDRPGLSCPQLGKDPLKKPGALYRQVLLPSQHR